LSHAFSLLWPGYFGYGGLENYLPELASNFDPPNLSLLHSKDYRSDPLVSLQLIFKDRLCMVCSMKPLISSGHVKYYLLFDFTEIFFNLLILITGYWPVFVLTEFPKGTNFLFSFVSPVLKCLHK
jgi:hypothetical protein